MHQRMAAALDEAMGEIRRIQTDARGQGVLPAPTLADDRLALTQRMDGPERGRRGRHRGDVPLPPSSARRARPKSRTSAALEVMAQELPPRRALRRQGVPRRRARRPCTSRRAAHERKPSHQWGPLAQGLAHARFPANTPSRCPRPARWKPKPPGSRANSCATCSS